MEGATKPKSKKQWNLKKVGETTSVTKAGGNPAGQIAHLCVMQMTPTGVGLTRP